MESVNVTKENLCINKIVGQKNENFYVDEDVIIPDIKPDILNAISTNGNVCIYKKEVQDGKIKIEGTVNVYIMYLADTDKDTLRSVNTTIDFTHVLDIDNAKSNMNLDEKMIVKNIECKVLNGRKINIKVGLELEAKVYSNDDIEVITNINDIDDIQMLNKEIEINSLLGQGNTKSYAKDTIVLDDTDNLLEILKCDINIINKDIKYSYNKILAKADTYVKIMYLTEDNAIKSKEVIIPVMGFIDMPNIEENNVCDMNYNLSNLLVKPNSKEEHSIYVEAEICMSCIVYEAKNVMIIQDLYSPNTNLNFSTKQIKTMINKNKEMQVCNIRQKISIPELENHELYNVDVKPTITKTQCINKKILYEGELELDCIYEANNVSNIDTKKEKIAFDFTVDAPWVSREDSIQTDIEIVTQDFIVLDGGSIDLKVDLMFNISSEKMQDINVIDEIVMDEDNNINPYSMTIYFVKKQDTLWNIAKRFRSTVEDVARVNNIEDENKIYPGQQLYIPKYVK